jgi:hypothetical protein
MAQPFIAVAHESMANNGLKLDDGSSVERQELPHGIYVGKKRSDVVKICDEVSMRILIGYGLKPN